MFHKRDKAYREGIPPSKRLRSNLGDLLLSNKISGQRAQEIFSDAALAGASHVADLAKGSDNPSVERLERNPNAARSLARRLLKNCPWPTPYWAQIPVWDVQDQKASICKLPLLLPLCREGACLWLGAVPGQISFVYTEPSSFARDGGEVRSSGIAGCRTLGGWYPIQL